MLVSILIPAHNAASWIADAIESALGQTHDNLEIVVVDDGSTDGTARIASHYVSERVRLIRGSARGGNVARNTALAAATGEYIQFLDADDVLSPEKIELQLARLAQAPPGSVACCEWAHFETGRMVSAHFRPEPEWRDLSPVDWLVASHLGGGMMPPHAWLTPREQADLAGPWADRVMRNQDGEYFARVVLASSGVVFTPGARVYYRRQPGGWRHNRAPAVVEGLLWAQESIARGILQHENSARTRAAMATSFDRIAFEIFPYNRRCAQFALARAKEFQGSAFRIPTNGIFGRFARLVGWRLARIVQEWTRRLKQGERGNGATALGERRVRAVAVSLGSRRSRWIGTADASSAGPGSHRSVSCPVPDGSAIPLLCTR